MSTDNYKGMMVNYILAMIEKWDGPLNALKRAEIKRDLNSKSKAELEELFSTFEAPAEEAPL